MNSSSSRLLLLLKSGHSKASLCLFSDRSAAFTSHLRRRLRWWFMAFDRRFLLLLLLLLLSRNLSPSSAVPASRSLGTFKDEASRLGDSRQAVTEDLVKNGEFFRGMVEGRRTNIELADYPETGANSNHDPKPPGRF